MKVSSQPLTEEEELVLGVNVTPFRLPTGACSANVGTGHRRTDGTRGLSGSDTFLNLDGPCYAPVDPRDS